MTFLAISIALLTGQTDSVLPVSELLDPNANKGGAGAYAAGYIIIIIIQFLWVFVFGSEPNSYLGQFGHGWSAMNNSVDNHHAAAGVKQPTQQQQQFEMTTDKTMVPAGGFNSVSTNNGGVSTPAAGAYEMQGHPAASSPQSPAMVPHHQAPTPQESAVEYKERVEALHDCKFFSLSFLDMNRKGFEREILIWVFIFCYTFCFLYKIRFCKHGRSN